MKYSLYGLYGVAITLISAGPVSELMACGVCEPSDGATASLSDFGLLHLVCCGSLLVIGLILLLFRKSKERGAKE